MSNIYISTIKLGLCDQKKEKPLIKSYVKILVKSMTERDLFLHISIYSTSKTVYSKEKKNNKAELFVVFTETNYSSVTYCRGFPQVSSNF